MPASLRSNVERGAKLVCLTDADQCILEFTVLLKADQMLSDATEWLGRLSSARLTACLNFWGHFCWPIDLFFVFI